MMTKMWKTYLRLVAVVGMIVRVPVAFAQTTEIENPIGATSFEELVVSITAQLVPIAAVLATIAIVFAGFKYIVAAAKGNPAEIQKANKLLVWVLVGTAIVVGASVIANAVVQFAKELK